MEWAGEREWWSSFVSRKRTVPVLRLGVNDGAARPALLDPPDDRSDIGEAATADVDVLPPMKTYGRPRRSAVASQGRLVRRALLAVARHDLPALAPLVRRPLPGLAEGAALHRLSGLTYSTVQLVEDADLELLTQLRAASVTAAAKHLQTLADLRTLLDHLDHEGIPAMVFKGPILAELAYDAPWHRNYVDLDVVVPASAFPAALDSLPRIGAELSIRNWDLLLREMTGEVGARLRLGTHLDLHWHLAPIASVRRQHRLPMEELFDRRRLITVGGQAVPTLDPVATIVYLAAHACWSGAHRLIWLIDIRNVLQREPVDWNAIIKCAQSWAVELPLAITLQRMGHILGEDVTEPLNALSQRGSKWQWAARNAGRWSSLGLNDGHYSPHEMMARATRASSASSTIAFAEKLVHVVSRGGVIRSRGRTYDAEDSSSMLFDAPAGKEIYLDALQGSASGPLQIRPR